MVVIKTIMESFSQCLGAEQLNQGRDQDTGSPSNNNEACCQLSPGAFNDVEHAKVVAEARKKASATARHRKSISSNSMTPFEKAKRKSNKRKLDIFRKSPEPPQGPFSTFHEGIPRIPQVLCFANPIFDEEDTSRELLADDPTVDESTIASTVFFEAKYENVKENRLPIPLFEEFMVPQSDSNDDLIQIYQNGSHKTIQSIHIGQPRPAYLSEMNSSIMDTDSSESDMSYSEKQFLTEHIDSPTASCMPSPSAKAKKEVAMDIVAELTTKDQMPGLKLLSPESSSTAALTPINSSASYSPKRRPSPQAQEHVFNFANFDDFDRKV